MTVSPSLGILSPRAAIVLLAGLTLAPIASAHAGERYAFLVGVQTYTRSDLRPLKFSDNDIVQLGKVLQRGGFARNRMMALSQSLAARDVRFTPFRENILAELRLFVSQIQPDDVLVVGLAGHGVQFQGDEQVYFCPGDADVTRPESLISINSLYDLLKTECKAQHVLLLVDACRNDPLSNLARSRRVVDLESSSRPQQAEVPRGLAVLFSCSAGEQAFEHPSLSHGVFFHHVINGLAGKADADGDREITLSELTAFATPAVQNFAIRELRVTQTPQLRGEISGVMGLTKLPAPVEAKPAVAVADPSADPSATAIPVATGTNGLPPAPAVPATTDPQAPAAPKITLPVTSPGAVPVATVVFPGPDAMIAYLESLAPVFGRAAVDTVLNPLAALSPHFDVAQPGVVFLDSDGESATPFVSGFARLRAADDFRQLLAPYPVVSDTTIRRLSLSDGSQVFVREEAGWLFFSVARLSDVLINPPEDPAAHLAEADGANEIVAHIYNQNLPAAVSDTVATVLSAQLRQRLAGKSGPAFEAALAKMVELVQRETGRITIRAAVDADTGRVKQDVRLSALPRTRLAEILEGKETPAEAPPAPRCPPHGCRPRSCTPFAAICR